jgi:16S rRNA (cytidine1402-2'-O)-methyltransferase
VNDAPTLYLLPVLLGDQDDCSWLCGAELECLQSLRVFFVENERSARRFLRKAGYTASFDETQILRLDKDSPREDVQACLNLLKAGHSAGILSEAGCPGIADPGSELVKLAHRAGFTVYPFPGPSSIFLTLMASGMNGQAFRFHGYLPVDSALRKKMLLEIALKSNQGEGTQLFMETPYRNQQLLGDILKYIPENQRLCIGQNIGMPDGWIRTRTIKEWNTAIPELHKKPAIFAFGT